MPRVLFAVTARSALSVITGHIDHLATLGWHVDVVVGEPVASSVFPRANVIVLPMRRDASARSDARALRQWISLLKRIRPDVVIGATPKAAVLSLTAAKLTGVPHRVWWAWGVRGERLASPLVHRLEAHAARLATVSVAASDSLAEATLVAGSRVRPLVLGAGAIAGVDLDVFYRSSLPGATPTHYDQPVAIYLGRLARGKGIAELADVWRQVSLKIPEARLIVAGEADLLDPPGAPLTELRAMPSVDMVGHSDDAAALLRYADLMIFPCARDGLPAVVLEAAASEVPTVAWDVVGVRDAIVGGVTGSLVPAGDTAAMADAVVGHLRDRDRTRLMGAAARAHVADRFERTRVEASFAALLATMMGRPAGSAMAGVGLGAAAGDATGDFGGTVPAIPEFAAAVPGEVSSESSAHDSDGRGVHIDLSAARPASDPTQPAMR